MKKNIISFLILFLILNFAHQPIQAKVQKINVTSPSFLNRGIIPDKHACDILGDERSPSLSFSNAPSGTQSFALILTDPDFKNFVHWIIFNIPAGLAALDEGLPKDAVLDNSAKQGTNGAEQIGYFGPCPPPKETHRYVFKVFALDTVLELEEGASKRQLISAMKRHIIGRGKLVGKYKNNTDF